MSIKWKCIDRACFVQMRDILPPEIQTGYGFLVGEPCSHRTCNVTGLDYCPTFAAFIEHAGHYYEATSPMTNAEFRCVTPGFVLTNVDEHEGATLH